VRIAIALPCYGDFSRETTLSLAMMMLRLGADPPKGLDFIGIDWRTSSNLPESRAVLASRAIVKHKADAILWIDSDMGFPADTLHRLLAHELDIVGCNAARRIAPHTSSVSGLDGRHLIPKPDGIEEVSVMGFGVLLTRTHIFEKIPPYWFAHEDEDGYCTEDVVFCKKARAAGFSIWCDHGLSAQVTHTAAQVLRISDIEVIRDVRRAEDKTA